MVVAGACTRMKVAVEMKADILGDALAGRAAELHRLQNGRERTDQGQVLNFILEQLSGCWCFLLRWKTRARAAGLSKSQLLFWPC